MSLVEYDLRSNVDRSSTDCECPALVEELREAEVSEFEVAIIADKQIFRLQVPEDDVLAVEILKAGSDSGGIEACLFSGEALDSTEIGEEFAPIDKF